MKDKMKVRRMECQQRIETLRGHINAELDELETLTSRKPPPYRFVLLATCQGRALIHWGYTRADCDRRLSQDLAARGWYEGNFFRVLYDAASGEIIGHGTTEWWTSGPPSASVGG